MKKGSNAAETVRDGVAGLWRKGADMKWSVPAGAEKAAVGMALLSSLSYGRPDRHASDTSLYGFQCCSLARLLLACSMVSSSDHWLNRARFHGHTCMGSLAHVLTQSHLCQPSCNWHVTCNCFHGAPKCMAAPAELPRDIRDALVSWDHAMEYEGPPDFTHASMMYEKTYDLGEQLPALRILL